MEDEAPQLVRKRRLVIKRERMEKANKGCADTNAPTSARITEMVTSGENSQVHVRKSPSKENPSPTKEVEEEVLVIDD